MPIQNSFLAMLQNCEFKNENLLNQVWKYKLHKRLHDMPRLGK